MEKAKRTFPSNIRIEKNKDGTAIIHARDIYWKAILGCIGVLIVMAFLFYASFEGSYISLKLLVLGQIIFILVLLSLGYLIASSKLITIRLEADHISKTVRSLQKGQLSTFPSSTIDSVGTKWAYQPMGMFLQELILHFDNGNETVLLSKIPDVQTAVELRDFINHTYGFDEKPKNQEAV
jgi:hypothetical protein